MQKGDCMVTKIETPIVVEGDQRKDSLGMVHLITGDGKGKTTSSLGLALRAIGTGYTVHMIQFLKSGGTGELYAIKHLPHFTIEQFGADAWKEKQKAQANLLNKDTTGHFVFQPDTLEREAAQQGFLHAKKLVETGACDVLILDEINCVLDKGLISIADIVELIKNKGKTELLLTGRDAPAELYEHADYISVIGRVKHPWQRGIRARRGIEY